MQHALFMRCRGELAILLADAAVAAASCIATHACATRDRGAAQRGAVGSGGTLNVGKKKLAAPACVCHSRLTVGGVAYVPCQIQELLGGGSSQQ